VRGVRSLFGIVDDDLFQAAGRALQILQWDEAHRFCGLCGSAMAPKTDERAKLCPQCNHVSYPRISPAIIAAVTNGSQILLARSSRFAGGFYSVLAGFVEIGETLEMCVHREIMEEVGIRVANIRYFGSQSWAFSSSLMIGFTADYAGGDIKVDMHEIVEAAWFGVDNLPNLPGPMSISRRLIDNFIAQQKQ
jgi:NAD+ diphosphatase